MTGKPTPGRWGAFRDCNSLRWGVQAHTGHLVADFGDQEFSEGNAKRVAELDAAVRALETVGYNGLETLKALPELMGVCKRLLCVATEAGAWHPERFEADRDKAIAAARALLDPLTKKGGDDAS